MKISKNVLVKSSVLAVMSALSISVIAGGNLIKNPAAALTIDHENRTVYGALSAARFSESPTALIGCSTDIDVSVAGTYRVGKCEAFTEDEGLASCITTNIELIEQIRAINTASYVSFSWEVKQYTDGSGEYKECTSVFVRTNSAYIPVMETAQ